MATIYKEGRNFTIEPSREYLKLACCDCGLIHRINMDFIESNKLSVTISCDRRATGQLRRHKHGLLGGL